MYVHFCLNNIPIPYHKNLSPGHQITYFGMLWTSDVGRPNLDVAYVALRLVAVVEPHSPRSPVARCVSVSQGQVGVAQLLVGFSTFVILFTHNNGFF